MIYLTIITLKYYYFLLFLCYYLLHLAEIIESKNTCEKYSKINHVLYHQKVDFQKILANNILKSHINYHIKK